MLLLAAVIVSSSMLSSPPMKLKVTEIFFSLQGETTLAGLPTVFVRLTGCPLRCQYCDSAYAFTGGETRTLGEILSEIKRYKTRYVTVTGGEPLAQPACLELLKKLCDEAYFVSLETSGALDVSAVDRRVVKILDIKTPGSLELKRNRFENLAHLNPGDQIKFVICDRNDYEWSKKIVDQYQLAAKNTVLFSASYQQLNYQDLADWIVQDELPVRFQLQMHKVLWGDLPGK